MTAAPNRFPRWLAPAGRTFLQYPDAFLTNFPARSLRVGPPPASLSFRVVPPGAYQVSVTRSNWFAGGHDRQCFSFSAHFPAAPVSAAAGTAFVLHGYGNDAGSMMPVALRLAEAGWRCVVPDLRGHGDSTGRRITFGVVESRDLSALLDAMEREGPTGPVAVLGHSYGAALALRWRVSDPRVRGVVALAPYASVAGAGLNIRAEYSPWFPESMSRAGFLALPAVLGVGPGDLDPETFLQRDPCRALFVVGTRDQLTPPLDASRLKTFSAPGSELLLVKDADHEAIPYAFTPVMEAVLAWLRAETKAAPSAK